MIYKIAEGSILNPTQEFLDDYDVPLSIKAGYPRVSLVDKDKMTISSAIASPSSIPGSWTAPIPIPNLGLTDLTEFVLKWKVVTTKGEVFQYRDSVAVEPLVDTRDTDIVALFGDPKVSFVLPIVPGPFDIVSYQIYHNNTPLLEPFGKSTDPAVNLEQFIDSVRLTIPLVVSNPSLQSNLLKVDVLGQGGLVAKSYLYNLWAITPQLFKSMLQLEDFINKSRIENVIPELRYTVGDLLGYLERGLNYFNMVEKPTYFNGMNMQGVLFDAHLICSEYYALTTQIIAEGSLAFDFSGQGISLNVDRTPQLDSAIGRIEGLIDSRVVPLKKELVKNGITGGDGSVGSSNMNNVAAKGVLTVMNAATTRIHSPMGRFLGRRR